MAALFPRQNYKTVVTALANTNKTTCYSVGDDKEIWADVVAIAITDSTGSVATGATIHVTLGSGITERVLAHPVAAEIDDLYTLECLLHLDIGGSIAVTGASGHNVWVSFIKGERADANRAQG